MMTVELSSSRQMSGGPRETRASFPNVDQRLCSSPCAFSRPKPFMRVRLFLGTAARACIREGMSPKRALKLGKVRGFGSETPRLPKQKFPKSASESQRGRTPRPQRPVRPNSRDLAALGHSASLRTLRFNEFTGVQVSIAGSTGIFLSSPRGSFIQAAQSSIQL